MNWFSWIILGVVFTVLMLFVIAWGQCENNCKNPRKLGGRVDG